MKKALRLVFLTVMIFTLTIGQAFAESLLPIGGSEWDYNPYKWNDTAKLRSNCYQYAVLKMSSMEDKFKVQPGYLSGREFDSLTKSSIVAAVKRDMKADDFGVKDFYETTKYAKPPKGYRKVALVIAPNVDYHWYEQNSNGYWSHKPGLSDVTDRDASGDRIADPETCDRYYVHVYTNRYGSYKQVVNYSTFCGWFMVK